MKIIVNMKLLHEQTNLCDKYMMNAIDNHERNLFEGISNLLDAIGYALTYDKEIEYFGWEYLFDIEEEDEE